MQSFRARQVLGRNGCPARQGRSNRRSELSE